MDNWKIVNKLISYERLDFVDVSSQHEIVLTGIFML